MNVAVGYPNLGNLYQTELEMGDMDFTHYVGHGFMVFTGKAENKARIQLAGTQAEMETLAYEILSSTAQVRMGNRS